MVKIDISKIIVEDTERQTHPDAASISRRRKKGPAKLAGRVDVSSQFSAPNVLCGQHRPYYVFEANDVVERERAGWVADLGLRRVLL